MMSQLAKHPQHGMRNRLPLGARCRFHEVDHCFNADALGRIEQELPALRLVASHLQKALERSGLE
jgi:hypothetical protein